jgi:hypothetical protein
MKKTILKAILVLFAVECFVATSALAQGAQGGNAALVRAINQFKAGQTTTAANEVFKLIKRPELESEKMQMRYILGLALMKLELNQVAAFQFVDVLRKANNNYTKLSIDKLIVAADKLGDETLLNYAVAKLKIEELPAENRDMVSFRVGEALQRKKKFAEAADYYAQVPAKSRYFAQAKYNQGLSYLEGNQVDMALRAFRDLYNSRSTAPVTDTLKVAAQLAMARAHYQKKDWENALVWYRSVPRDHEMWHEALFESSWALFMNAKLRSAMSNFQSLHSIYYENFYLPEPLLLRAITYLYICKYDELDKVLTLFERTYGGLSDKLGVFVSGAKSPTDFYTEIEKAQLIRTKGGPEKVGTMGLKIPYPAARYILQQGDFEQTMGYLRQLTKEKARLDSMAGGFASSAIGNYAGKILANRIKSTKILLGEIVRDEIQLMRAELRDFYEQASFIRYELINARKETLQRKIEGKEQGETAIDDKFDRKFYVQNGYEYYPFRGEFWLDEIGNYHYMGKSSCK